jgi:PKD repeat protein
MVNITNAKNQTNITGNTTQNTTQPPNTTGNQTNQTNQTNSKTGYISIASWYPQGMNYIFICNPSFGATSYDWNFGDGQKMFDVSNNNVWHTYSSAGIYEVTCTATNGVHTENNILKIKVGAIQDIPPGNTSASVNIAPYFPQGQNGNEYVFNCNANGFTPTSYDWNFGDGQ